jgi:hypothetical protein
MKERVNFGDLEVDERMVPNASYRSVGCIQMPYDRVQWRGLGMAMKFRAPENLGISLLKRNFK